MALKRHHLNTAIYLGTSLLCKAASVLLIPIYTSRLTRSEYGVYGLCLTLYAIVPSMISLGLGSAFGRFFYDHADEDRRARTLGSIAGAIIATSIGVGLLAELALDILPVMGFSGLTTTQHRLVLWTCAFIPIVELPAHYLRTSERAGPYAFFQLTIFGVTSGTTVVLMLIFKSGLTGPLGGMFAGQLVGMLITIPFILRVLKPSFDKVLLRQAIWYSIPFIPHAIGNALMTGADRWALEYYNLRDGLGLYTLATQLTLPIGLAAASWNVASAPRLFAGWRDGGYPAVKRAFPRSLVGFVVCGGVPLLGILAGLPLIRYLVGDKFQAALSLVPWVGLSVLIGTFFSAFVNVLELKKSTRIIPFITIGSVGVNVGLNFVLVPAFGVYGAILATSLAFMVRNVVLFLFAMRAMRALEQESALRLSKEVAPHGA